MWPAIVLWGYIELTVKNNVFTIMWECHKQIFLNKGKIKQNVIWKINFFIDFRVFWTFNESNMEFSCEGI